MTHLHAQTVKWNRREHFMCGSENRVSSVGHKLYRLGSDCFIKYCIIRHGCECVEYKPYRLGFIGAGSLAWRSNGGCSLTSKTRISKSELPTLFVSAEGSLKRKNPTLFPCSGLTNLTMSLIVETFFPMLAALAC